MYFARLQWKLIFTLCCFILASRSNIGHSRSNEAVQFLNGRNELRSTSVFIFCGPVSSKHSRKLDPRCTTKWDARSKQPKNLNRASTIQNIVIPDGEELLVDGILLSTTLIVVAGRLIVEGTLISAGALEVVGEGQVHVINSGVLLSLSELSDKGNGVFNISSGGTLLLGGLSQFNSLFINSGDTVIGTSFAKFTKGDSSLKDQPYKNAPRCDSKGAVAASVVLAPNFAPKVELSAPIGLCSHMTIKDVCQAVADNFQLQSIGVEIYTDDGMALNCKSLSVWIPTSKNDIKLHLIPSTSEDASVAALALLGDMRDASVQANDTILTVFLNDVRASGPLLISEKSQLVFESSNAQFSGVVENKGDMLIGFDSAVTFTDSLLSEGNTTIAGRLSISMSAEFFGEVFVSSNGTVEVLSSSYITFQSVFFIEGMFYAEEGSTVFILGTLTGTEASIMETSGEITLDVGSHAELDGWFTVLEDCQLAVYSYVEVGGLLLIKGQAEVFSLAFVSILDGGTLEVGNDGQLLSSGSSQFLIEKNGLLSVSGFFHLFSESFPDIHSLEEKTLVSNEESQSRHLGELEEEKIVNNGDLVVNETGSLLLEDVNVTSNGNFILHENASLDIEDGSLLILGGFADIAGSVVARSATVAFIQEAVFQGELDADEVLVVIEGSLNTTNSSIWVSSGRLETLDSGALRVNGLFRYSGTFENEGKLEIFTETPFHVIIDDIFSKGIILVHGYATFFQAVALGSLNVSLSGFMEISSEGNVRIERQGNAFFAGSLILESASSIVCSSPYCVFNGTNVLSENCSSILSTSSAGWLVKSAFFEGCLTISGDWRIAHKGSLTVNSGELYAADGYWIINDAGLLDIKSEAQLVTQRHTLLGTPKSNLFVNGSVEFDRDSIFDTLGFVNSTMLSNIVVEGEATFGGPMTNLSGRVMIIGTMIVDNLGRFNLSDACYLSNTVVEQGGLLKLNTGSLTKVEGTLSSQGKVDISRLSSLEFLNSSSSSFTTGGNALMPGFSVGTRANVTIAENASVFVAVIIDNNGLINVSGTLLSNGSLVQSGSPAYKYVSAGDRELLSVIEGQQRPPSGFIVSSSGSIEGPFTFGEEVFNDGRIAPGTANVPSGAIQFLGPYIQSNTSKLEIVVRLVDGNPVVGALSSTKRLVFQGRLDADLEAITEVPARLTVGVAPKLNIDALSFFPNRPAYLDIVNVSDSVQNLQIVVGEA